MDEEDLADLGTEITTTRADFSRAVGKRPAATASGFGTSGTRVDEPVRAEDELAKLLVIPKNKDSVGERMLRHSRART